MTTKTQTSTITLKTLGGVFEQPKMNHRRDFLRENKLSLKELQKNTTHKLIQQKQENERKQYKHLQKFQKSQEQNLQRRSASRCRSPEQNGNRQSRKIIDDDGGGHTVPMIRGKPNYLGFRRAYSQQRKSVENIHNMTSCCCSHNQQHDIKAPNRESYNRQRMPRSASSISVVSKAESCDKEIQTEDIHDEDFLYEALKKCSSTEVHQLHKQRSIEQLHTHDNNIQKISSNHNLQQYEPELNSIHSHERVPHLNHYNNIDENKSHCVGMPQYTNGFQNSRILNGDHHNVENHNVMENGIDENLDGHLSNLKINDHIRRNDEQPISARSRQTLCSTSTKRSVHILGARDDVRLPRYLEKEKREKEEERQRELTKDPNCPLGHYALSEEERLKALHKAQKKMDSLINELNHMPMTTETLRIRNRKVEIEKELTQIELDIRFYSKPKVYVPEPSIHY